MCRSAPSILYSNISGDTKDTTKITKQNNRCAGQDSKRAHHEYNQKLLSLLPTFSIKRMNDGMSNFQTGEDQHAHIVYADSQRTTSNIFLYRNIQKNKQEFLFHFVVPCTVCV